jgi:hypothetical protein
MVGWFGSALLLVSSVFAVEKTILLPNYPYPNPLPFLMVFAAQEGVNVKAWEFPPVGRKAAAGDELTFLVSLRDGKAMKQWILAAKMAELTDEERQLPPLEPFHRYISTGAEVKFEGRRAAIEMVLLGPMKQGQAKDPTFRPDVKRRRLLVNAEFLELGFKQASVAELALLAANAKRPPEKQFGSAMGEKPFPPEVVAAGRARAAEVGITPENERAFYSSIAALSEFFHLMVKTPGLQDILKEVIDVSWWSLLTNGGTTNLRLTLLNQNILKLSDFRPGLPQYAFPFATYVNGKPALAVVMSVTEPQSPFATTAGVLGLQAGRPYDDGPQLTVRLIGTRYVHDASTTAGGK